MGGIVLRYFCCFWSWRLVHFPVVYDKATGNDSSCSTSTSETHSRGICGARTPCLLDEKDLHPKICKDQADQWVKQTDTMDELRWSGVARTRKKLPPISISEVATNIGIGSRAVSSAVSPRYVVHEYCVSCTHKPRSPLVVFDFDSDILYPLFEQEEMVPHLAKEELKVIRSVNGHDGFLFEQNTSRQSHLQLSTCTLNAQYSSLKLTDSTRGVLIEPHQSNRFH